MARARRARGSDAAAMVRGMEVVVAMKPTVGGGEAKGARLPMVGPRRRPWRLEEAAELLRLALDTTERLWPPSQRDALAAALRERADRIGGQEVGTR